MQEGIKVKNRDIIAMQNIMAMMQECVSLEKRARFCEDKMHSLTRPLTGMPGRKGGTPSGFEAAYANMDDMRHRYREKADELMAELKRLESIINAIPFETMRAFVMMMYIDQLPNVTVRNELNMTEYGFQRAKRAVEEAENMQDAARKWKEKYIFTDKK